MISKCYIGSILFLILIAGVKSERKLTAELNPGCKLPECRNNKIILFHVKAEGQNDTLHHLWDFTGKPSFILALTDKNATVSVSYTAFENGEEGAIAIKPAAKYVYGTLVDTLIEFNDDKDTGILDMTTNNSSYVSLMDTMDLDWKVVNISNNSSVNGDISLTIESTDFINSQTKLKKNGTVHIVMTAFAGKDHADTLPHLLHTDNSTQMDLTLDGLSTQYKNTRFGLRLVTVSSDNPNNTVTIRDRKTMDDEHAPGVFTITEVVESGADDSGFLQWRPVVYTTSTREMTSSTDSVGYSVSVPSDPVRALNKTMLYSLLGNSLDTMLVTATNVTFGIAGDGFYRKYQYATWTMMMSYGHPAEESFSMLVALVLFIGLGVPTIIIMISTVCIVMRRLQRNKDDLFLSR